MPARVFPLGFLARLAILALLAPACSGPGSALDGTPPIRVVSDPVGAQFFVPRLRLEGETPFDFAGLEPRDEIVISKEGYREWIGRIEELPQVSGGAYKLALVPVK